MQELIQADTSRSVAIFDTTGDITVQHDLLFDPTTTKWNPLAEAIDPNLAPTFFAQAVKDGYKYDDLTTPVMSMYLSFLAAALIENRHNLTDAPEFLTSRGKRDGYSFSNTLTQHFWDTFETLSDKDKRHEIASTLNKFLTLLLDGRIYRMLSVNNPSFTLSDIKDKTLLVRLPVHEYGKETVEIIGSLLLTYLYQLHEDRELSIYLEDCDLFARATVKNILTRGQRKGVSMTVSHQYISQLDPSVFAAIMGSCAERYIFRVSPDDSDVLGQMFPAGGLGRTLDTLENYTYRRFPYIKLKPDSFTIPLENT
jgi:hypothetical protein